MAIPKISVNKLGEYLTTNAQRREKIVMDQKYPREFKYLWYADARRTIVKYFVDKDQDEDYLVDRIEALAVNRSGKDIQLQDRQLSIEALKAFLKNDIILPNQKVSFLRPSKITSMNIAGVKISIAPDLMVSYNRAGIENIGLIKLHFGKHQQLSKVASEYVSTLLHQCAEIEFNDEAKVNKKWCLSIDVFSGSVVSAPVSFIKRRQQIESACREIELWWKSIT